MNLIPRRRFQSVTVRFLLVICATFVTGCSYYRIKTVDPLNNESIAKAIKEKKKYVILHNEVGALHLKDVALDNGNQSIAGVIEDLPANHHYYKKARPEPKANRYVRRDYDDPADEPIYEIHIYTTTAAPGGLNSQINIPFSTIEKVEVYDRHHGATVAVYGLTTAAVLVALVILVTAMFASVGASY